MRTRYAMMLLALVGMGLPIGCGEQAEQAPAPVEQMPKVETEPKVPAHGLVIVAPSRAAERVGPSVGFDVLAEAKIALTTGERGERLIVQSGEVFGQPGRLRFYLEPVAWRTDEESDVLIADEYEYLELELEYVFQKEIRRELNAALGEQAILNTEVASVQLEMSTYLASRRGIPDTPESRREKARLDHALTTTNAALLKATENIDRLNAALEGDLTPIRRVR